MYSSFDEWVNFRKITSWGTNFGANEIAFQGWRHFKEAFVPELIKRAFDESVIPVKNCLDPFGGSGTTALACQFLGVNPTTIEVNPYLADLIESKLSSYNIISLAEDFGIVVKKSYEEISGYENYINYLPKSFVEPGVNSRWIFDSSIAKRIFSILCAIDTLHDLANKRLLKILLGGILVDVSNIIVNGKGRRYRKNWNKRKIESDLVNSLFERAVNKAITDISEFSNRRCLSYNIYRGDSRLVSKKINDIDLCVFSPPYPNSFDYTDVYNVELWMLNYLRNQVDNKVLRLNTLTSHVQVKRKYAPCPEGSILLNETINELNNVKSALWNKNIPDMVGAYFNDMIIILNNVFKNLSHGGEIWMVVGDSKYAGVKISTAKILIELMSSKSIKVINNEAFRSMRTSAQQGGQMGLDETLITLRKI